MLDLIGRLGYHRNLGKAGHALQICDQLLAV
jgi:hypothetical protein